MLAKFQRTLSKLRKDGKFTDAEYREIYPSDAIPPRMYGMVKAHKPSKNFPMRTVVSTIGTVSHSMSKMLVKLIQPTLNKNSTRITNSTSFVCEAKSWNIEVNEIQVSYDVVALYPSIPISKAIKAIMDILHDDAVAIRSRTKLELADIKLMIELCLSKCYFLYESSIFTIDDAGPIGLSLMVVMAEGYLQYLEINALNSATIQNVAPKTFKRYVDDSHTRFTKLEQAEKFLGILNEQDPKIQYTMEIEDTTKSLAFLDVQIRNDGSGSYDCKVYRKDAITNVQMKPHSSINPSILDSVFKGFLVRAHRICSPKHVEEEIAFLIDVFVENGHIRSTLQNIANTYVIPEKRKEPETEKTSKTEPNKENSPTNPTVTIPWIPILGPKLRRIFKKNNIKVIFTSSPNLKSLLCNNKSKLPPNSQPGVYKLDCSCGSSYIGETKKKISTRLQEHQKDIQKERWASTGCSEHAQECEGMFEWDSNVTIAVESNYRLRKVREALEIKRRKTGPDQPMGLNRDNGNISYANSWNALFRKL